MSIERIRVARRLWWPSRIVVSVISSRFCASIQSATAFGPGLREALGAPGVAMAATFLAFGAAVQEAGLSPGWALLACWGIYGMPGQLVLVQAATAGWVGGIGAAVMGAVAVNARFLPMAVSLTPVLAAGNRRRRPRLGDPRPGRTAAGRLPDR